jgi:hypothetical protein
MSLALAAYFAYIQWINPAPFYTLKYDPEMPYFINSLALFKGAAYAYVDHPGTPLEVIGSFLLAITRPLTRAKSEFFIPYHVANPQIFLTLAHGFLVGCSIVTLIVTGLKSIKNMSVFGALAAAGVAASYFAIFPPITFDFLGFWTHNGFNFPFGTLLLLVLLVRLRQDRPLSNSEALLFGIFSGLLAAVQLYFFAWAIGIILSLVFFAAFRKDGWRHILVTTLASGVGVALGFFIAFEPVMHRFREFYIWVRRLVFHQGVYGKGSGGVTSLGRMIDNLRWLWNQSAAVFIATGVILFLLLIAIIWQKQSRQVKPGWWALTIGLMAQLIVLWAVIGKHPGEAYLLSIAAVLPILLALALEVFLERGIRAQRLAGLIGLIAVLGFIFGWVVAIRDHSRTVADVIRADEVIAQELEKYANDSDKSVEDMTILWGYGVPSRCYALRFGNVYTENGALTGEINELCPNEWMYDVWGGYVELPNAYEPLSENFDWDIVILPERYLPESSGSIGEITVTDALTQGFGRIAIIKSSSPDDLPPEN